MKLYRLVSYIAVILMISTVGISAGITNDNAYFDKDKIQKIPMNPLISYKRDVQLISSTDTPMMLPTDIPIIESTEDESNPYSVIDKDGNPIVIFEKNYGFSQSALGFSSSPDRGETWPEENYYEWNFEDTYITNPKITTISDGIGAIGSYNDYLSPMPDENFIVISDINDPETWEFYCWDNSGASTYILETSSTVCKDDVLCFATISDYNAGDLNLIDAFSAHWHLYPDREYIDGVIFRNTDFDGNPEPLSNLTSAAGEKVFFVAEEKKTDGYTGLKAFYCDLNQTTVYSDWRSGTVAGKQSNCTNPDLSVSGERAYCVYMDDQNGNQDIYVATTTNGGFWLKTVVAESEDDELYPAITANGNEALCMFMRNNDLYVTKSEDAGKTWSNPIQVNDDSGSLVEEYGNIDLSGAYGFWTSNKEGNNDIYFEEVGKFPEIIINGVAGGFGATATISNVGNADAEAVAWNFAIDGGLVISGDETSGTITVPAGATVTISTGFILAFGKVTITVTAGSETKTVTGFALGPFVINVV